MKKVCYAMGFHFGDLDNDGYPDCLLGTGAPDYRTVVNNSIFRNIGGKYFEEVTTSDGVGNVKKVMAWLLAVWIMMATSIFIC